MRKAKKKTFQHRYVKVFSQYYKNKNHIWIKKNTVKKGCF